MVIDTSAITAILTREPTADRLVAAVEADTTRLVSAATVVEAALVLLGRYGEAGEPQLDRLLAESARRLSPSARSRRASPATQLCAFVADDTQLS